MMEPIEPGLPREFGRYSLLEETGRGGYGIIYKARQAGLDRLCALKMLLDGRLRLPTGQAELLAEARAAAKLDHPNIVGIYEVGEAEGRPFFSMEYVEGENLAQFTRRQVISAARVAEYTRQIAEAIDYAHAQGVLHCDLKPANIIIDHRDQPRITDFGLARSLGRDGAPTTASGNLGAGSPNFMAPEQASGRFGDVGIHTDVFGIGAILYYLLTDRPPFRGETAQDTIRAVIELDPVRPRIFRPGVPLDLETICLKCLEKRRSKRYANAQEVSDELGRFLRDEPILARPVSRLERSWRRARRHPWLTGFASATALLLTLVAVGSSVAAYRINEARQTAELGRRKVETAETVTRQNLYAADMALAFEALSAGQDEQARRLLERHVPQTGDPDLRGWEWRYLEGQSRPAFFAELRGHQGEVHQVQFLPGGRELLASDNAGGLHVWDVDTRRSTQSAKVRSGSSPAFAVNPTGQQIAVTDRPSGSSNTVVRLLTLPTLQSIREFPIPGFLRVLAYSPDGQQLWLGGNQRWVSVSIPDGAVIADHSMPFKMDHLLFGLSRDKGRLLTADREGKLVLFNLESGAVIAEHAGHESRSPWKPTPYIAVFSPDDQWIATGAGDGSVRLWNAQTLAPKAALRGHTDLVISLAFSPDGKKLISAGRESDLILWDLETAEIETRLHGNPSLVRHIEFRPDGTTFFTAGNDQVIREWRLESPARGPMTTPLPESKEVAMLLPDEQHFALTDRDWRKYRIYRMGEREPRAEITCAADASGGGVGVRADDAIMAAEVFPDGRLRVRTLPDGPEIEMQDPTWVPGPPSPTTGAEFSPDGQLVAVGDLVNGLRVWRLEDRKLVAQVEARSFNSFRFSPDGRFIMGSTTSGRLFVLELASGRVTEIAEDAQQIPGMNFTPDGRLAATAGIDGTVRVIETESGKMVRRLASRAGVLMSVALTPDGSRVFGGGLDGLISVWDMVTGRELGTLGGSRESLTNAVFTLAVTPTGDLISTSSDGLRRWCVPLSDPADSVRL